MERKHIAEEIHFDLKELFEICQDVICKEKKKREEKKLFLPAWMKKQRCIKDLGLQIWECQILSGVEKNGMK